VQIRNLIVLVVDGWGAPWLGPYGNTWVETSALNRLAADSFLCEHAITDTPSLAAVYRSYWRGVHAMCPDPIATRYAPLASVLEEAGVTTVLVTDEPQVATHPLATSFGECRSVDESEVTSPADDLHETRLAQLFATATARLAELCEPYLLWIHSQGMLAPWDAPLCYRHQFAAAEDPIPPDFFEVPCRMLPADYDPDELLGIAQAYAGQIAVLDACVGGLLASLSEDPLGTDVACLVTSPRGFPVGEHLRIGFWDNALYGEITQVPWIMRLPDPLATAARTQALVQPADLYPTLLDWYRVSAEPSAGGHSLLPIIRGDRDRVRDRACVVTDGEQGIRTKAWYLRRAEQNHLFAKPDDRWEVNEVSDRCGDVPQLLTDALEHFARAAQSGDLDGLDPLPDVLEEGIE
jgi:arylsulfatase A-like enzyme